jgi:hypothetical protein
MKHIQVIKVAAAKAERMSQNPNLKRVGKTSTVASAMAMGTGKMTLGNQGYMTLDDYEMKNFAPYGLKESDIRHGKNKGFVEKEVDALVNENAKLLAEIEKLKAMQNEPKEEAVLEVEEEEAPVKKTRARKKI